MQAHAPLPPVPLPQPHIHHRHSQSQSPVAPAPSSSSSRAHTPHFPLHPPQRTPGHASPTDPHIGALFAASSSRAARAQRLNSRHVSVLSATANGCMAEMGFAQLQHQLKRQAHEYIALRSSFDSLTRKNALLLNELATLRAEKDKRYEFLLEQLNVGSSRHSALVDNYKTLADEYRKLRSERDALRAEKDTLQKEVHILRNTRSLNDNQQHLLLEMKYAKLLAITKAQATGSLQDLSSPMPSPPTNATALSPNTPDSEPVVIEIDDQAANDTQPFPPRPVPERILTTVLPNDSIPSAQILSQIQLPSPVDSTASVRPSVLTPLSNLRFQHFQRPSRSASMPHDARDLSQSPDGARAYSTPVQQPSRSGFPNNISERETWTRVTHDPSSSRVTSPMLNSHAPIQSLSSFGTEEHIDVRQGQGRLHDGDTPIDECSLIPSAENASALNTSENNEDDLQLSMQVPPLPELSDASSITSPSLGEVTAMDLSASMHEEVSAPSSLANDGAAAPSSWSKDYDLNETKPMIREDGSLLFALDASAGDVEMPEQDEEEEEEEDLGDLTDDEGPDGSLKHPPLICCSQAFYDDSSDLRRCQMCEMRHGNGFSGEAPPTFTDSSLRDLVLHLKSVHPAAWGALRSGVEFKEEQV